KRISDLFIRDHDGLRDTRHKVAAFDLHRLNFIARVSRTDSNFDQLRRSLTHEQIVFSFYELGDGLIHLVTTHSDGAGKTIPDSEITATSVVPPPISTIILPVGSVIGNPAPMAAAIGSSMR